MLDKRTIGAAGEKKRSDSIQAPSLKWKRDICPRDEGGKKKVKKERKEKVGRNGLESEEKKTRRARERYESQFERA